MLEQIIMAGSGGQGIQFNGQVLARAAVKQGLEATYVPSYGAERRGGPSFCSVVLGDSDIYAPVFQNPDVFLAFDQRARNQYAARVKASGVIIANSDLASRSAHGEQARVISIPASQMAREIRREGGPLNLIMLGAYLGLDRGVQLETVRGILEYRLAKKSELLHMNLVALTRGSEFVIGSQS